MSLTLTRESATARAVRILEVEPTPEQAHAANLGQQVTIMHSVSNVAKAGVPAATGG